MIDTVRFFVFPTPDQVEAVKFFLSDYLIIDNTTGEHGKVFTRGNLAGSFDYRIRITIKNSIWVHQEYQEADLDVGAVGKIKRSSFRTEQQACPEYLDIELSLAKFADNINFINITQAQDLMRFVMLQKFFSEKLGFEFPAVDTWELRRVDLGRNYHCGDNLQAEEYIKTIKALEYPRRQKAIYQNSIYFKGSLSTFKIYNKHLEFKFHDFQRLKSFYITKPVIAQNILKMSEGIVRAECELHNRWLKTHNVTTIRDLMLLDFNHILDVEIRKVLGGAMTRKIMYFEDVKTILQDAKDSGAFGRRDIGVDTAVAVWTSICLNGKKQAMIIFGRRKVYRALALFEDFSIPLTGTIKEEQERHIRDIIQLENYLAVGDDLLNRYYMVANL